VCYRDVCYRVGALSGIVSIFRVLSGWCANGTLPQCFRCWHFGHAKINCRSDKDRTGACFRCGQVGHNVAKCDAGMLKCVVCEELRKESRHTIGTTRCLMNQGYPRGVHQIGKNSAGRSRDLNRNNDDRPY